MRKLIYDMTVSVDGFVEAADGSLDWGAPSPELHQYFNDRESVFDLHIYGRRLYELMAAHWPTADQLPDVSPEQAEYARIWRSKRKIVFSKTLQSVGWNSTLVRGDLLEEINRLKSEPGNYMALGGPGLAASCMQLGCIDEYWLYIKPILLGAGKRMFPALDQIVNLELLETRSFPGGTTMMRYGRVESR